MILPYRLARGTVTAAIIITASAGICAQWSASKLTPLQKFLTKKIEGAK